MMEMSRLKAPFSYFGGKAKIANRVWAMLGDCKIYVEPFLGSGAVLLSRPGGATGAEIVNDLDANVANFWRAIKYAPDAVAESCDFPLNHSELVARREELRMGGERRRERCEKDPTWYDCRAAGVFAWCSAASIGGPAALVKVRAMPCVVAARALFSAVELGRDAVKEWIRALSKRLRGVRVLCMDWRDALEHTIGLSGSPRPAGVFLDPPYADMRGDRVYQHDSPEVSGGVREWCAENGADLSVRIVLCGYGEEHDALLDRGWGKFAWQGPKGRRGGGNDTNGLERLWTSPGCLQESIQQEFAFDENQG